MILVNVDVPENYQKQAKYIFQFFSHIWGIPLRICCRNSYEEKPHIIYTSDIQKIKQSDTVVIPFDEELYKENTVCNVVDKNGICLWTKSTAENGNIDLIASSYRLITFMDELQIKEENRDRKGRFTSDALALSRRTIAKLPLIEAYAQYLLKRLLVNNPNLENFIIPRWPNLKKYVISITHDTDAISLGAPGELLTNFIKFLARRNKTQKKLPKL